MAEGVKETLVERAKRHYRVSITAWEPQRLREYKALRFQIPEGQWDPDAKANRGGGDVPGSPIPAVAKPMISIDKLNQPIRLIVNQQQQAQLGVNVHAISETADDEDAKVKQGVYRSIERNSNAPLVRNWSFERAVKAGTGAYKIITQYCDHEGAHPFDQEIRIKRLVYQECALFDPAALEPDFSDGEYAFVTEWMPLSKFKRLYRKAAVPTDPDTFGDLVKSEPLWVRGDGDNKAVLVATYYEKEHTPETIVELPDGSVVTEDKLPKDQDVSEELRKRTRDKVTVKVYTIAAGSEEPLTEDEWMGQYIPLVPVIGDELQPFDQHRRFMGLVERAMGAQQTFNYAISQVVLMTALEPNAPWLIQEGQIEGYEAMWQQSATRNFPALIYKGIALGDKPAPPPQRTPVDAGRLGPSMMLVQEADKLIQATTAIFDPSLGNLSQRDRSGKAILALQGQGDAGTSQYLYNLAQISMRYEAKVILDAMPHYYDRAGRIEQILNERDEAETVMLNAPYTMDPKTGRPKRVPQAGVDGQIAGLPQGAKFHKLTRGSYDVSVTVGKSWQTRLQQGADEIGQVLQALPPEAVGLILPLYFKYRDFPGAKEISELLKKDQEAKNPHLVDDEAMTPERAEQENARLKQENQQQKQLLDMAAKAIETDKAKQQATLQKAAMEAESKAAADAVKVQIAEINAAAKIQEQAMEARLAMALEEMRQEHERLMAQHQSAHEAAMGGEQAGAEAAEAARGREFEAGEAEAGRQSESEEKQRDRETASQEAERDRQAAAEQAAQKAKEPKGGE